MKTIITICVLMIPISVYAQRYKTIELKPITKQGWRYFYDFKKVNAPIALEIPLMALNDDEVTTYYRTSKAFRTAAGVMSVVPIIYLFTLPNTGYVDPTMFWIILGGTLATQLGLEALGHVKLGKAIDRYNVLIFQPSSSSIGLEMVWRF